MGFISYSKETGIAPILEMEKIHNRKHSFMTIIYQEIIQNIILHSTAVPGIINVKT